MNKTQLNQKCREIWGSYKQKSHISKDDKNWLINEVFSHHPNWSWWNNQGVKSISVGRSSTFKTPCFYIHFENGKCSDISWIKSINNINYDI